jgi:hypothetical protein
VSCVRIFALASLDVTSPDGAPSVATPRRRADVFRPVLHPRGRAHYVWVAQRYVYDASREMSTRRALERCARVGATRERARERARGGVGLACATRMARLANDGAPCSAVARVGIVEKNSLRRRARVLARDVRRRGCDERMRD